MSGLTLWLRWSMRDLRQRWLQVVAIAMIIALGTGAYCGLGSNTPWRLQSLDESYAMLNMYDLRVALAPGSAVDRTELGQVLSGIEGIEESEMRLVLPTFVDASTPERTILVSGRIVGVHVATGTGGPVINGIHLTAGRALAADDQGQAVCVVEHNFAAYYGLQPGDREIQVRGGLTLDAVGIGMSPEYFMVVTEEGGMMAQAGFAALFVPLETAQEMAGLPGRVNDLLITLSEDADVELVQAALQEGMAEAFPEVGVTFETNTENEVYTVMYGDVEADQAMFDIFSFLLLAGAAFGSFTLASRMVEAQRREIGINMALGVKPVVIARRYVLAGLQIALLGVLFGIAAGRLLSLAYGNLLQDMMPMPVFEPTFQVPIFLTGALLGAAIPLLAALYPIWRALRVAPIEAIQTGYLVARGGGLAPVLARLPLSSLPGSSIANFPFRNLVRNPRRTLLTTFGITMAVIVLFATIGMLDSFQATLDAGSREHLKGVPDRTLVTLDSFYPVTALSALPQPDTTISEAEPLITLPGTVWTREGERFGVIIQLLDLDNDLWAPTLLRSDTGLEGPGVIISEKAARDLQVDLGDTVILEHPQRESMFSYRLKESELPVVGIHADVLRFYLYMDMADAAVMNLQGLVNSVQVSPAAAGSEDEVLKELAHTPGVASLQSVSVLVKTYEELLDLFVEVLGVSRYVALLLAFLVAFNTTSINVDERRRDLATMFAFGTPVGTTIRMAVIENLAVGVLSTFLGAGLGWALLNWILTARMETMVPEIGIVTHVAPTTLFLIAFFGVALVALTPVLTVRKLTRMDIPSTLRVIE